MTDGGSKRNGHNDRVRGQGYYSNRLSSGESSSNRQSPRNDRPRSDRRPARGASASAYRSSSERYSRSSAQSRREAPAAESSGLGGKPSVRLVVLAFVALALIVTVGVLVSKCMGQGEQSSGSSNKAASAGAVVASASSAAAEASAAASGSADSASSSASPPAEQPASSAAAASAASPSATRVPVVNAQPGDVTYVVAEAAKLHHRDADFAVNPARTDWNYDEPNGHKTIYLTFDDGPSANTERVLDVLDQYNCKATFFVTGQNPDYFPWIKEAYNRGHTIGLHSYTHDYESCYSSVDAFWNEFDAIGEAVKEQIGYVPCFIRFPGGASNTISASYSEGIMSTLVSDVLARGYQYYDWEYSCGDGAVHTADELVEAGCQPIEEENVIYLLHDGSAKETTAEALPRIIEYYQAQGFSFEALDRNSLVFQHDVSN